MNQENPFKVRQNSSYNFMLALALVLLFIGALIFAILDLLIEVDKAHLLRQVKIYQQNHKFYTDQDRVMPEEFDIYGNKISDKYGIDKDGRYVLSYKDGIVYINFSKPNTSLAKKTCPKFNKNYAICMHSK